MGRLKSNIKKVQTNLKLTENTRNYLLKIAESFGHSSMSGAVEFVVRNYYEKNIYKGYKDEQ